MEEQLCGRVSAIKFKRAVDRVRSLAGIKAVNAARCPLIRLSLCTLNVCRLRGFQEAGTAYLHDARNSRYTENLNEYRNSKQTCMYSTGWAKKRHFSGIRVSSPVRCIIFEICVVGILLW